MSSPSGGVPMSPTASETPSSTACLTPSRTQEKKFIKVVSYLKCATLHFHTCRAEH